MAAPLQIVAGVEIRERGLAIELSVRVKPRASRDRVLPPREGRLELSVTAPPEDGKANLSVCRLLADVAGIAPSRVRIESGQRGRNKRVVLEGVSVREFGQRLSALQT